jgi:hypothetical protein
VKAEKRETPPLRKLQEKSHEFEVSFNAAFSAHKDKQLKEKTL